MDGPVAVSESEKQLHRQLIDVGVELLSPPPSTDELLAVLDRAEDLFCILGQDPSCSLKDALLPAVTGLVSDELLRHPNMDVKVSVLACIHELLRVTAPEEPYQDDKMMEIFQQTLIAFESLALFSGRCYTKALHILETVAKVRSCVILLDLGCDALIIQLFQLLLNSIRSNHTEEVFSEMEEIMTRLIEESNEISLDLLKPLLASVKKENQDISPLSSRLGAKVLKNCSVKVKPCLMQAVKRMRLDIDDYTDVVASICPDVPAEENVMKETETDARDLVQGAVDGLCEAPLDDGTALERNNGKRTLQDGNSSKALESHEQIEQLQIIAKESVQPEVLESGEGLQTEASAEVIPRKKGRKPEDGNKHSGSNRRQTSLEVPRKRKNYGKLVSLPKNSSPEKSPLQSEHGREENSSSLAPKVSHLDSTCHTVSVGQIDEGRSPNKGGRNPGRSGKPKNKELMVSQDIILDKAKNAEGKPGRGSWRKKSDVKKSEQKTSDNIVVKKEVDMLSDSEGTPNFLLSQKDGKTGKDVATAEYHDAGESVHGVSKKPRVAKRYGEELIGSRVKVWWPMDKQFYEGVVDSFDPLKKKHKVLYVDGDEESLNLQKERWLLLDDSHIQQDQETNLPSSSVAPVKSEKKESNLIKKKSQIKQDNNPASSKRRSQPRARKVGNKSAQSCTIDTINPIKTETVSPERDTEEDALIR